MSFFAGEELVPHSFVDPEQELVYSPRRDPDGRAASRVGTAKVGDSMMQSRAGISSIRPDIGPEI